MKNLKRAKPTSAPNWSLTKTTYIIYVSKKFPVLIKHLRRAQPTKFESETMVEPPPRRIDST